MKATPILIAFLAIAVASISLLKTQSMQAEFNEQQSRDAELLSDRIEELDGRLRTVAGFQAFMGEVTSERPATESSVTPISTDRKDRKSTAMNNRIKNQGRANDNQWREIDKLKTERLKQGRQINQLTNDLARVTRDLRNTEQQLVLLKRKSTTYSGADLTDVKRRVDELYRMVNRR